MKCIIVSQTQVFMVSGKWLPVYIVYIYTQGPIKNIGIFQR